MKRKSKYIIIAGVFLFFIAFAIFGGMLGAGSYGYAEQYNFGCSQDRLIAAIKKLKHDNPILNPPDELSFWGADSLDVISKRYFVSAYSSKTQTVYLFFIESIIDNKSSSNVYLVLINNSGQLENYRIINKDLNRKQNLRVKKEFEEIVLDKLNIPYKDKGNNNFIFWK